MVQAIRYVMASLDTSELNQTFELLTHPYRRYVLYYLSRESDVVSIDALATAIARWNGDHTETGRTPNIDEIVTGLHHNHLPKLANAGIITFGPERESIELGESGRFAWILDETAGIDGYMQTAAGD